MKQTILSTLLLLSAITMHAQYACRIGNQYVIDGQTMNKQTFAQHMQEKAETQLANQFSQALKTANTGWGLLGAGLGAELTGSVVGIMGFIYSKNAIHTIDNAAALVSGMVLSYAGSAAVTAGIVCLGVGYSRMHNAADVYLHDKNKKQPISWSIQSNANGVGLAVRF